MNRMLILDFDGTMTDAEREGAPFRTGYLEDIATLVGLSFAEVDELARGFEAEVAANPNAHGWIFKGRIVAPATVDPYLRIMPVARKIFDACGAFPGESDRSNLLDGILYKYNYPKTEMAFRAHAGDVLRELTGTPTWIVTNSHTVPVQNKVRALDGGSGDLEWLVARVFGRAQKYVVDEDFADVPESLTVDGLDRPVLLRRHQYHDVIAGLIAEAGSSWEDLLVVGDIFELDLSLPLAMGARVGLVVNDFTPEYERRFVADHPRGTLVTDLRQIPGLLRGEA